jgi:hypothetical protein
MFPQPAPWIECQPRPEMTSSVTSALSRKRSDPGWFPPAPQKADHTWKLWLEFCKTHALGPWFNASADPVPFLQVFGQKFREGKLSYGNQLVRAGTVTDAIRTVGQAYQQLGSKDLRIDKFTGKLDFRHQRQLKAYEKQDPAPTRVKPIPLQLVQHVIATAHDTWQTSEAIKAVADMTCIAFFFPGEYTITNNNKIVSTPRHPSLHRPTTHSPPSILPKGPQWNSCSSIMLPHPKKRSQRRNHQ